MKGQELKIVFKDDFAFLTDEVALDFTQVEIPYNPVKFKVAAFWTIRVINYIENEKKLFIEVLDYQIGDTQFSYAQQELADILGEIEKVTFKSIDTSGLLGTLYGREPIKILPSKPEKVYRRESLTQFETNIEIQPIKHIIRETFSVPIKNITFVTGGVTLEKKLPDFKPIKFQIENENIVEEFDAVKNYFANVLGTKKINVTAIIEFVGGLINPSATSEEIDKIDQNLIDKIKFEFVKSLQKKEPKDDRQMFTIEEYFDTFADAGVKPDIFFKDDVDFFENLLKISNTKHYNHLRFLSSKHRHDILKLQFIPNPFSFIFLLSGIDKFFIIWETLDTEEATYIWTINKDDSYLKDSIKQINKTIKLIKEEGKNKYISQNEKNFSRIYHDYKDSLNGFKNWKSEIDQLFQLD